MNDEDIIEDILDEFDFYKVQKAMELLEWTWGYPPEYPSVGEMRKVARGLMRDLIKFKEGSMSTGGLVARKRTIDDGGDPLYELAFVVTSWDNYD